MAAKFTNFTSLQVWMGRRTGTLSTLDIRDGSTQHCRAPQCSTGDMPVHDMTYNVFSGTLNLTQSK